MMFLRQIKVGWPPSQSLLQKIFFLLIGCCSWQLHADQALDKRVLGLLKPQLAKNLSVHPGKIELTLLRSSPTSLGFTPTDEISFIAKQKRSEAGQQVYEVHLEHLNRTVSTFVVIIKVALWRRVVIAKREILPGEILQQDMLTIQDVLMDRKSSAASDSLALFLGKKSLARIRKGGFISKNMIRTPPLIQRGDEVVAEFKHGNLTISAIAIARKSGKLGDKIDLTCKDTGQRLRGIIRSANQVVIN